MSGPFSFDCHKMKFLCYFHKSQQWMINPESLQPWLPTNVSLPPIIPSRPTTQKLQTQTHNSGLKNCSCKFLEDQPVLILREHFPESALTCRIPSSLLLIHTILHSLCSDSMSMKNIFLWLMLGLKQVSLVFVLWILWFILERSIFANRYQTSWSWSFWLKLI